MKAIFFNDLEEGHVPDILDEICVKKIYQPYFEGKSNLTILDLGANIGLATQYFSQFGKVYAVEPSKEHFECLEQMIKFNNLDVKTANVAIAAKDGLADLYHNPNVTAYSLNSWVNVLNESEKVTCESLPVLFTRFDLTHVDFMKIDIEGEEFNVFGSDSFDEVAPKIDVIMGEIHDWANRNPGQVYQALQNRGFKVKRIPNDAHIFYAERL